MIRFTRAQVQPIGVDIGSDSVKLLQMEIVGNTLAVVAAARQPLPPAAKSHELKERTAAAAEVIRQMIRHNPFSCRKIVAALPRDIVHVKNLRLPLMPLDEVRSAIEFEVKNIFPFETKDAHVRFLHAGEVRQGADARQEVIVVAATRSDVDTFLCELHRCGAAIESLDFEPAAIYRSVERFIRRREDEQEVHVLVDVGGTRTQVVIGRGENISFFKPIEIGGQHLHDAVARKLGISSDEARDLRRRLIEAGSAAASASPNAPDDSRRDPVRQAVFDATRSIMESLATEVSLCLRYHSVTFRGHRPTKLRLVGGEASDPQLLAVFNSALPLPTEAGRPLHSVDTSRMKPADRRGFMSEWTAAFGLSLRMTTGRFGSRDGKQRNPTAPRPELGGSAEVIDLTRAVATPSPVAAAALASAFEPELAGAAPLPNPAPRKREVVHA
jgi:type IV pilus assembly protein PilM